MARNVDRAITRIEREIAGVERNIDQAKGRAARCEDGSWERNQAEHEVSSLSRRLHKLFNDLEELEREAY